MAYYTLFQLAIYTAIIVFVYKVIDRLIRIPRIDGPEGKKKNILVTGCDTGFGSVFARRMSAKGFVVFAGCLTDDGIRSLDDLQRDTLKTFSLDVTKETSIRQALTYVTSQLPSHEGLWAIVNNAGIMGQSGPFEWLERDDYLNVMNVNVFGMFMVTKIFAGLVKKTRGRVINTCSVVGRCALPYSGPYVVSKYAAEGLSDGLRRELYEFGVSLHMIEPGLVRTNIVRPDLITGGLKSRFEQLPQELRDEYGTAFLEGSSKMVSDVLPKLGSGDLDLVVDCYDHAVTAMFPRTRYMTGWDAKYLYMPTQMLPEWLSDGLLSLASRLFMPRPAGHNRYT